MVDPAHQLTLGDVSRENSRRYGDQVAVVCGKDRLDYRTLDDRASRLANVLRERGCGGGSTVLWVGQNCHRILELVLAAAKIGGCVCPANWRASPDELRFVLEDLQPDVVVWQDVAEISPVVAAVTSGLDPAGRRRWIAIDGPGGYEALLDAADPTDHEQPVDPFEPVLLIYTGAFGGTPNAAELTHAGLLLMGLLEAPWQGIDDTFAYLNNGPMFHVGNWRTMTPTFQFGGKNVFVARVDAETMCRLIATERCTGADPAPPTRQKLEELNADRRFDLTSLRDDGGSPAWRQMISPVPGRSIYGQTEVGGHLVSSIYGPRPAGGTGRAIPLAQVRIVDADDVEVARGDVGEIVARGPAVIRGYRRRPDLNEERFRGGWWHTGDLGRRESDGSITFVGVKQRMLKSGLENIYPAEVEQCVRSHPDVADCAVIGVPDPVWTQSVKAIVVARAGASLDAASVIAHCVDRIAGYKKPKSVEVVDAIPRPGGLVDYEALDAAYGGGGYPGHG